MKLLIGGSPSKLFHLEDFAENLKKNGVETKVVIDTEIYTGFPSKKISNWFEKKDKLKQLIKEFKPDFIFVDRQTNFALESIKTGIPVFVHLRGDFWTETQMAKQTLYKSPPKRLFIKLKDNIAEECFKNSQAILPICSYLENIVKEHHPKSKTHVLYQGIDPSKWYKQEGMKLKHPCIGIVQSSTIWGKTKELLILPKVMEKFPNVMFYWVGDGPYRDKILPILEKYKNFQWLGKLDYPEKVRQFLSEIDIYALISGLDMSPLTLQEAQLMEKPVIATDVGGIPELMKDKETGYLVRKGDADDLIEKINSLLDETVDRKKMGNRGKEFVSKKFSWDIITKQFIELMKNYSNK
ncbi:MAG: glycosyl transferase family 1 [Chloroflexi bacterium]|nr:glycosyl transferase family 1 [Chloroflexota bacterium]